MWHLAPGQSHCSMSPPWRGHRVPPTEAREGVLMPMAWHHPLGMELTPTIEADLACVSDQGTEAVLHSVLECQDAMG